MKERFSALERRVPGKEKCASSLCCLGVQVTCETRRQLSLGRGLVYPGNSHEGRRNGALRNLAAKNAENKVAIAAQGGIGAVLKCMGRHADSPQVCQEACWALRNLAGNAENKAAIRSAGAADMAKAALKRHSNHSGVQKWGTKLLENL